MAKKPAAEDLTDYTDTHSHPASRDPELNGIWAGLVFLAVAVALLSLWISGRANRSDQRVERERVAICAILHQIPSEGHPAIAQAKTAFDCN